MATPNPEDPCAVCGHVYRLHCEDGKCKVCRLQTLRGMRPSRCPTGFSPAAPLAPEEKAAS